MNHIAEFLISGLIQGVTFFTESEIQGLRRLKWTAKCASLRMRM